MADKSKWKTPSMESEGKGDGHQYGRKPRTPEPIPIAGGNSPSEEEMGHWTPTGVEPKDYDDDDDKVKNIIYVRIYINYTYLYTIHAYAHTSMTHLGILLARANVDLRRHGAAWPSRIRRG